MPLVSLHAIDPLADGRQSARALMVRRGVWLMLDQMGFAAIPEMTLKTGRRADLAALSPKGDLWIIEIKSSLEDLRADRKWQEYRAFCDRFYFATHAGVPRHHFPEDAGFILSDGHGAEMLSPSPEHRLAPAARKSLTLRFARLAAARAARAEPGLSLSGAVSDQP
ncbi:MAG: MmcB family DNA repair protein [Rhizobiaceae bacterium]|jgi:hypothetical protein|nr:MmcB family DNA repair protein [Rhizobiaceae bacterium]